MRVAAPEGDQSFLPAVQLQSKTVIDISHADTGIYLCLSFCMSPQLLIALALLFFSRIKLLLHCAA